MKVVINKCFGGYSLSLEAQKFLGCTSAYDYEHDRTNPILVAYIEKLGEKADGDCAELKIVEIPDGTNFVIESYDGMEHIAEVHRIWY